MFRQDPANNSVNSIAKWNSVKLKRVGQNAIASCWLLPVTSGASISYHFNYCPPSNPNHSKATAKQKHQIFSTTLISTPWSSEYKATAGLDKLNLCEVFYFLFLGWIFMKHFSKDFLCHLKKKKTELSGILLNPHQKKGKKTSMDYWLEMSQILKF